MYYQFVLPYLQSSSKIYSPMLIYMGITVVSVLPNTRGSTLGRKREHYSENKSVRSKSQEFSRKFKRSGVCFNDLWRVLYVRICGDTFKNLSSPRAYWSLSETVTSLMILFISQQSDVEIVVRHWASVFSPFLRSVESRDIGCFTVEGLAEVDHVLIQSSFFFLWKLCLKNTS